MSRPANVDTHGVAHRPGCTLPGWTSTAPLAGIHILRCSLCGAVRLTTTEGRS